MRFASLMADNTAIPYFKHGLNILRSVPVYAYSQGAWRSSQLRLAHNCYAVPGNTSMVSLIPWTSEAFLVPCFDVLQDKPLTILKFT